MATLIIAAALVAAIAAICLLIISFDKKQKRNAMNIFLNRLSQAGSSNNLNFTSQELLNDIAIGLDAPHRKLLILTRFKSGEYFNTIIDVENIQSCLVKKEYGFINAGTLKTDKLEKHLKEIALHIELYNYNSADVPFYNHIDNTVSQADEMEKKAKKWETIITTLLNDRFKKNNQANSIVYKSNFIKF
jgi:hypothetical protein